MFQKLIDYWDGKLPEEERNKLIEWMVEDKGHLDEAREIFDVCALAEAKNVMDSVDTGAALEKVHGKIGDVGKRHRRGFFEVFGRAAAVLLIPLFALTAIEFGKVRNLGKEMIEVHTVSGTVHCIQLPDGSMAWLNGNTDFSYPAIMKGKRGSRDVYLSGEAYIKVAADKKHPFIVHNDRADVTVTGTEFDFEAYPDSAKSVRLSLISGEVNMGWKDRSGNTRSMVVEPGQRIELVHGDANASVVSTNLLASTAWKDGNMVFLATPFEDVLRAIENRFGVHFIVKNKSLLNLKFTGAFTDQNLDTILEHFTLSKSILFKKRAVKEGDLYRQIIEVS